MQEKKNYDVIIIGGGPAGVSAALYACRGGLDVCIVHSGGSALKKATIQNYYGTGTVDGEALYKKGIEQAKEVGAEIVNAQATSAAFSGESFDVTTTAGAFASKRLVIATGAARQNPSFDVSAYEGKGVSYCAVCDAFFCRNKNVAVLGAGEYAKHEYDALSAVADVTLLTDGKTPSFDCSGVVVDNRKISRLVGENGRLAAVEFEDGTAKEIAALFIALGVMGSAAIAKSMGVITDKSGAITVDGRRMTNIDGLYAAGDCTKGVKQVAKAVCDGMTVGYSLIEDFKGTR